MLTEDRIGDRLLRKVDACRVLEVSKPTLDRMISRGDLSVVRVSERVVRLRESTLRAFIEQRTERRGQ